MDKKELLSTISRVSDALAPAAPNIIKEQDPLAAPAKRTALTYQGGDDNELEVVCAQCSFPVVPIRDEQGEVTGFKEVEGAPQTLEEAAEQGWLDHGMGLLCLKCSLVHLEEMAHDEAEGAVTNVHYELPDLAVNTFLRSLCPEVSEDTLDIFTKVFRHGRAVELRSKISGLPPLEPMLPPIPKDEQQAVEFLKVTEALAAYKKESTK